ncbi:hypothetical protein GBAR_LOCUS26926, partial [Geodia barretti]
ETEQERRERESVTEVLGCCAKQRKETGGRRGKTEKEEDIPVEELHYACSETSGELWPYAAQCHCSHRQRMLCVS